MTLPQDTNGVGAGFGFVDDILFGDDSFGADPGVIAPDRTWTYAGQTVDSAFGTTLGDVPVVLWTHGTTSETISISHVSAVPEPASLLVLGAALSGLFLCRRDRIISHAFTRQ